HLLVRDPDDSLGRLQPAEGDLGAEALDRLRRRLAVELDVARQGRGCVEVAEEKVGVGDGRLGAAAAVAGRAWLRPGRMRPHPQGTPVVAPADRPAAGADRVDV